jgi:hypothetical protein
MCLVHKVVQRVPRQAPERVPTVQRILAANGLPVLPEPSDEVDGWCGPEPGDEDLQPSGKAQKGKERKEKEEGARLLPADADANLFWYMAERERIREQRRQAKEAAAAAAR